MTTLSRLVGEILTGFPLAQQRASLVDLLKTMAISNLDITELASTLEGQSQAEIVASLSELAKSKNQALRKASEYLNDA